MATKAIPEDYKLCNELFTGTYEARHSMQDSAFLIALNRSGYSVATKIAACKAVRADFKVSAGGSDTIDRVCAVIMGSQVETDGQP